MNRTRKNFNIVWLWILLLVVNVFYTPIAGFTQNLLAAHDKIKSAYSFKKGLNTVKELEIMSNWFFKDRMKKLHIPGAVLVVVKNDSIFFKKGYGYANLEKKLPVKPDETLFRIGSITKLFTVTAVIQLAERGVLGPNDNVNDHLELFKIKNQYPNPITIANLLTHTAGFDHQQFGKYARSLSEIQHLGVYLKEHMPKLTFNPGEFIMYSNYGISLAGYLVEEISKVSFTQYIKENIFEPLQMHQSRFNYPEDLSANIAFGYKFINGIYRPVHRENLNLLPSGAIMTTASNIANFMIAHLNEGQFQNTRILKKETIKEMHQQQITNHPQMPGWSYGFYESYWNNTRAILHSGNTRGFSSLLFLLPEQKEGVFLVYNSNNSKLYNEFIEMFLDRFYPATNIQFKNPNHNFSESRTKQFLGNYKFNNSPKFTIAKLSNLFKHESEIRLTSNDDGTMNVSLPDKTIQIYEVQPLLFKIMNDEGYVAFRKKDNGDISHMFLNLEKPVTLEKLSWWQSFKFQYNSLKAFYMIFIYSIAIFLFYFFKTKKTTHYSILLAISVCTINLAFLLGLDYIYKSSTLQFGINFRFIILLCLPIISTVLSMGLPVFAVLTWKNKQSTLMLRLHYSLITIAVFIFIPFLDYWNLIGFKF